MSDDILRWTGEPMVAHYYMYGRWMTAREMMDESRPLPDLALYALGWTDADIAEAKRAWNEEAT